MNTGHPSEMELQQYALDKSSCSSGTIGHIESCEHCQATLKLYQLLFVGIKKEPKPAFDFDLSELVVGQLNRQGSISMAKPARFNFSSWVIALLSCCTIGIPLYLFRKNMWNMFEGISVFFVYSILAAAFVCVLIKIRNMVLTYQKQMNALNFY